MKKCLAVGIILLFIGTVVIPSSGQKIEKSSLRGNWLYIGGSGPGNYTTIQDAINASSNGDTIFVYNDHSPYGNAEINKSITLKGEDKETTTLNSAYCESENIIITGFSINHLNKESKNLTIINNIFPGPNTVQINEGINFNFINNTIEQAGMSLWFYSRGNTISGNTIIINSSQNQYYCMEISLTQNSTISNNTFISFNGKGYGLYLDATTNTIENNKFINSGVYLTGSSVNNVFRGNTINGKALLYLNGETNKTINADNNVGQAILWKCNHITLRGLNISSIPQGIVLDNCNN